jgi:hypothetical protein
VAHQGRVDRATVTVDFSGSDGAPVMVVDQRKGGGGGARAAGEEENGGGEGKGGAGGSDAHFEGGGVSSVEPRMGGQWPGVG